MKYNIANAQVMNNLRSQYAARAIRYEVCIGLYWKNVFYLSQYAARAIRYEVVTVYCAGEEVKVAIRCACN